MKAMENYHKTGDKKALQSMPAMDSETVQKKINSIFNFIGVVFTLGFAAFYFSIFNSYKKSCEKHSFLTEILNNPNARVASGERAVQVAQHLVQNQSTQSQVPSIQAQLQAQGSKPALKQNMNLNQFLNTQQPQKESFNYSLCDSLDYQKESLLGNNNQAPQNSYYTLEQVASLLNQQRGDLESRQSQPVMRAPVLAPVQQQPISFGYKFGQAPMNQNYQAPNVYMSADIESNQTGTISSQNLLI
jgi:hypothetical protein